MTRILLAVIAAALVTACGTDPTAPEREPTCFEGTVHICRVE